MMPPGPESGEAQDQEEDEAQVLGSRLARAPDTSESVLSERDESEQRGGSQLPFTGGGVGSLAGIGFLLLLAGVRLMFTEGRKRRSLLRS